MLESRFGRRTVRRRLASTRAQASGGSQSHVPLTCSWLAVLSSRAATAARQSRDNRRAPEPATADDSFARGDGRPERNQHPRRVPDRRAANGVQPARGLPGGGLLPVGRRTGRVTSWPAAGAGRRASARRRSSSTVRRTAVSERIGCCRCRAPRRWGSGRLMPRSTACRPAPSVSKSWMPAVDRRARAAPAPVANGALRPAREGLRVARLEPGRRVPGGRSRRCAPGPERSRNLVHFN